jgi:hypothetical protein
VVLRQLAALLKSVAATCRLAREIHQSYPARKCVSEIMFRRWRHARLSTDAKLYIFIAVMLIVYITIWILYFLGFLPQLDSKYPGVLLVAGLNSIRL